MLCNENSWPHPEHFVFCEAIMEVDTVTSVGEEGKRMGVMVQYADNKDEH
jgi:hypothetical protein